VRLRATVVGVTEKADKARMIAVAELSLRLTRLAETEEREFGHS